MKTQSRIVRSISYAPDAIPAFGEAKPAWIVCRNLSQFPLRDDEMLLQWADAGRIRPDDYLVSTDRDGCLQAKDVPELVGTLRRSSAGRLSSIARVLALSGLALLWIAPLPGTLVLLGAVVTALVLNHKNGGKK